LLCYETFVPFVYLYPKWWDICRGDSTSNTYALYEDINREDYYCESRKMIFSFLENKLLNIKDDTVNVKLN